MLSDLSPTKDQQWREADREARAAYARKQLEPVAEIMAQVAKLRDRMAAICNVNKTDASDVACFYESATEWAWKQQQAWRE